MNPRSVSRRLGGACLAALLIATAPLAAHAQTAAPAAPSAATPAAPARLLVAHPVVASLTQAVVQGTGIAVLRPVPETLPANRQLAFFGSRGAAGLAQAARQADAVIALRSIWPDDPLFPLARRQNIRLIEIDAARPLDASLPGIALREGADPAAALPWLDAVNLGRMADVIAADVSRLVPHARPRLQDNAAALRQRLLAVTARSEARLARAANLSVFSLSDRLDYLVSGFNLDLVGTDSREDDAAWTPEALAALTQRLRDGSVAAALHHREPPIAVAQAVQAAGARLIVLQTEGRDPLADLQANAERLGALAP
ncbi:metal ABC transporter substrate-binding protein [Hydrogenophaga borbori]|uniref:Metal ABC transporter substrate-binding protein n=1 Tax=Hydrogenophaga borbori TaxID=2294117 RepID=A0A372EN56_9BURK|nr:zinc ABC transporter substrate-binding protein [Hydrogenophaga borbori]RFP81103.1 metal ABC transporter substrate-binding protein [Hydrogenophaga borbori]